MKKQSHTDKVFHLAVNEEEKQKLEEKKEIFEENLEEEASLEEMLEEEGGHGAEGAEHLPQEAPVESGIAAPAEVAVPPEEEVEEEPEEFVLPEAPTAFGIEIGVATVTTDSGGITEEMQNAFNNEHVTPDSLPLGEGPGAPAGGTPLEDRTEFEQFPDAVADGKLGDKEFTVFEGGLEDGNGADPHETRFPEDERPSEEDTEGECEFIEFLHDLLFDAESGSLPVTPPQEGSFDLPQETFNGFECNSLLMVTGNILANDRLGPVGDPIPTEIVELELFEQPDTSVMPDEDGFLVLGSDAGWMVVLTSDNAVSIAQAEGFPAEAIGDFLYLLKQPVQHANPDDLENEDADFPPNDFQTDVFTYTLLNIEGKKDAAEITLTIVDDIPWVSDGSGEVDEDNVTDSFHSSFDLEYGADGPKLTTDESGNDILSEDHFVIDEIVFLDTETGDEIPQTSGKHPIEHVEEREGNQLFITGSADGETLYTLEINTESGEFWFDLIGPIDHPDKNEVSEDDPVTIEFHFSAFDNDMDSDSGVIEVLVLDDGPITTSDTVELDENGLPQRTFDPEKFDLHKKGDDLKDSPFDHDHHKDSHTDHDHLPKEETDLPKPVFKPEKFDFEATSPISESGRVLLDYGTDGPKRFWVPEPMEDKQQDDPEHAKTPPLHQDADNPHFSIDTIVFTDEETGRVLHPFSNYLKIFTSFAWEESDLIVYGFTEHNELIYTLEIDTADNADNDDDNYTFTLYQPIDHPDQNEEDSNDDNPDNDDDPIQVAFNFTIVDDDHDHQSDTIFVILEDDVPETSSASETVDESDFGSNLVLSVSGDFTLDYGADGPKQFHPHDHDHDKHPDPYKTDEKDHDDGHISHFVIDDIIYTSNVADSDIDFDARAFGKLIDFEEFWDENILTIKASAGDKLIYELEIDTLSGDYDYTQYHTLDHLNFTESGEDYDDDEIDITFNFTITDNDGDTSSNQLTITVTDDIPSAEDDTVTILEENLPDTHQMPQSAPKPGTKVTGNIDIEYGEDGPKFDHENPGQTHDHFVMDDPIFIHNTEGEIDGTSNGQLIETETLWDGDHILVKGHANGHLIYTLEIDTLNDLTLGDYTFTLLGPIDHPLNNDTGSDDQITLMFDYQIFDNDMDSASGTLSVVVEDDGPTGDDAEEMIDESFLTVDNAPERIVRGSLNFEYGGDGPDEEAPLVNNSFFTLDLDQLDMFVRPESGGASITTERTLFENTAILTGFADGNIIFTLEVDIWTGDYTFELLGPIDHPDENETGEDDPVALVFVYTIMDNDGDEQMGRLEIKITDDGPTGTNAFHMLDEVDLNQDIQSDLWVDGSLNFDYGADGPSDNGFVTFMTVEAFDADDDDSPFSPTTNGDTISVMEVVNGEMTVLTGTADNQVIFVLEINTSTGDYNFHLKGMIQSTLCLITY